MELYFIGFRIVGNGIIITKCYANKAAHSAVFVLVLWQYVSSQHTPKYRASTSSRASWERVMAAAGQW